MELDSAHLHVVVRRGDEIALEYQGGDRRSPAHEALLAALRIRVGDQLLKLDPRTASVTAVGDHDVLLALPDGLLDMAGYKLCSFELRYASDHGRLHPIPPSARVSGPVRTPITDLHTHYAGCVGAADLLAIGADVVYPQSLLAEAGVHVAGDCRVTDLPAGARDRLARAFSVPVDRRITFLDMERIYRVRSAITKAPAAMPAILLQLARDYAAMGIRYVELSLGSLVEARVLRLVHAVIPAIEKETGVTIRFLLALSRHDDPEWDADVMGRLSTLSGSVYVAGIDVMGHETNSTRAFAPQLRAAAAFAQRQRPGFVVRVHAGESPSHPENVRLALEAVAGFDVSFRVGHGLYGVDDETLAMLVKARATIELNLDSNVALNHIAQGREAPIRRYLDAGARIVLGSDGYGIYGASAESAARAALVAGATPADLAAFGRVEEETIAAAARRDAASVDARRTFVVPDDLAPVAFTPEVVARRQAAVQKRQELLEARLAELRLTLIARQELIELCAGHRVISVAGAWQNSWLAMSADDRARLERELTALVDALDPAKTILVTGGTRFGVEGRVGKRALERGITVIGTIVGETLPGALTADAMTHVHVIAHDLYEKAASLYELIDVLGGACVFAGGGQIVKDEIQAAKNLGLPLVVFTGPGASGAYAAEESSVAVETGAEAASCVETVHAARISPHWFRGVNPTVDAVVLREGSEVLLIRRSAQAPVEPGAWALPGGFIATDAPRGGAWGPGRETAVEACVRELAEETALIVEPSRLKEVGVFEGRARDPRDGARSFSRSMAFLVELSKEESAVAIAGGDDAEDARWFPLAALPKLAFDHATIVARAFEVARPGDSTSGPRAR